MEYLTYKYKMYSLCDRNMYIHRDIDSFAEVYNHFIALHKRYYRRFGKYPSKFTMVNHLAKLKRTGRFAHWRLLPSQALQNVIERIDFGYQKFFARDNKRPPTFRSRFRYQSYTLKQAGYKFLERNKVRIGKRIFRYHNRHRARVNQARVHRRVANQRRDYHWQLAYQLCKEYDVMYFETLNIDAMKALWGRKISDLGFSDFLNILKYVAKKTGKVVKQIDKWLPTSKTCSACDTVKENLELRERTFHCCECGVEMDRDLNAAINIHRWGRPPMAEVA